MSKFTLRTVFLTTLFSFSLASQAQELPKVFGRTVRSVNPTNGMIRCASTEYEGYLKDQDPKRETREEFEAWLAPKVAEIKAQRLAGKSVKAVITIPVVVHVIHNGDAVGRDENIADAQVISQITVLNQDYRRMLDTPGQNPEGLGVDVEIEFCLAQTDPEGNPTTGIDRVRLASASWAYNSIDNSVKAQTYWDPTRYLNIWTLKFASSSNLLGYAQFPSSSGLGGLDTNGGGANTDGVVIGYQYFGSSDIYPQGNYEGNVNQNPYQFGRTATHEVGHYLGLRHISGDNSDCRVNATDSYNDYCPDTPATAEENYECAYVDSCPAALGRDMVENYMDYANDACMNIFTQNQKDRMVAVMNNATRRRTLKTSTVCQAPAGAEEFNYLNGINLYPNPATSVVNIAIANGDLPDSFTVYNSLGQQVSTVNVKGAANLTVNTSGYSTGIYFIKVSKGNQSKTLKFVKQ